MNKFFLGETTCGMSKSIYIYKLIYINIDQTMKVATEIIGRQLNSLIISCILQFIECRIFYLKCVSFIQKTRRFGVLGYMITSSSLIKGASK